MGDRGRAAVFVDRDGTLIRDVGYLCRVEQLEILPNVPEAIRLLQEKDYKVVVVTNQSAVARGRLTEAMLADIHGELIARLARRGARLDAVYYCPHHPTEGFAPYKMVCDCRKPNTAMIRRAETELKLDPSRSYIVGDQKGSGLIIRTKCRLRSRQRSFTWRPISGRRPAGLPALIDVKSKDMARGVVMRSAITGVAGFIGSHLAEKLLSMGHEVIGIDKNE